MAKPWEGRTSRVRGRPTEEPDQLSDAKCQIKFQLLPPSQPVRPPRIAELDAHNQQQIRGLVSANVRDALRQIRDAAVEYFGSECVVLLHNPQIGIRAAQLRGRRRQIGH